MLAGRAADGKLTGRRDAGVTLQDTVEALREDLRAVAEPLVHARYDAPLRAALASQRGGVLLAEGGLAPPPPPANAAAVDVADAPAEAAEPAPPEPTDWPSRWEAYQQLAGAAGLRPFEARGMVVAVSRDGQGGVTLELDPTRNAENALPAWIRLATLALGLALAAVHGPLAVRGAVRAARRTRALEAHYRAAEAG
jgi:hypothetical protein